MRDISAHLIANKFNSLPQQVEENKRNILEVNKSFEVVDNTIEVLRDEFVSNIKAIGENMRDIENVTVNIMNKQELDENKINEISDKVNEQLENISIEEWETIQYSITDLTVISSSNRFLELELNLIEKFKNIDINKRNKKNITVVLLGINYTLYDIVLINVITNENIYDFNIKAVYNENNSNNTIKMIYIKGLNNRLTNLQENIPYNYINKSGIGLSMDSLSAGHENNMFVGYSVSKGFYSISCELEIRKIREFYDDELETKLIETKVIASMFVYGNLEV